ncbi:MAG: PAS domain S-box protein [bacterium]
MRQKEHKTPVSEAGSLNPQIMQGILNSMSDLMMIVDKSLEIIWNNLVFARHYGNKKGEKCYQFLKPEPSFSCCDEACCIAQQTFSDGLSHSGEFSITSLSGNKQYYSVTSAPVLSPKRNGTTAVLLILRDITLKKRMEQDLCQLRELNEEIIKIVPLGIQVVDRELRICLWNPAMEKIMHIPFALVQGKKLIEISPGMANSKMKKIFEQIFLEGKPFFEQSHRQPMPDGSEVYYRLSIFPLKDGNGKVSFILICLEDITEHKSIENELEKKTREQARGIREWERKFSALVENSIEGIGISKGEIITYVNPSLGRILGYEQHELIGQSLRILQPDDESKNILLERLERKRQGRSNPPRYELRVGKKDGTMIDLDVSSSNIYVDGELITLYTVRDITERKEAEERERKLHEHMLHSDRLAAMGRFAAGVAHEINNPLAVLSGRIQELLIKYERDEELRHNFASMKRVSDRIGKIVDSLLFFSKQKEEPKYLYEINAVIEDAISMFERQTMTKGVRLIKHYAPNLPSVIVTASQIQQVCVNLLINAIDATDLGDVITISTRLDKKRESILIIFKDTGCGIPKEYQEKIFEPFFTTKEVGKGSGLGLSISSGIIKDHHGNIRVRSKEGSGTIFTIKLPLPTPEEMLQYGLDPSPMSLNT